MSLTIQLHKKKEGTVILKCIRKDGSTTWAKLHQGMAHHDLAHIAIEKSLGFKRAFYGMLASGVAISDYELPDIEKPDILKGENLPKEALIAEHLVNLLCVDYFDNGDLDFLNQAQAILCLLYTSPSPRDQRGSRMPSSA